MAAIISAILAIVGPLLGDLLKKWLDKILNKAAGEINGGVVAAGEPSGAAAKKLIEKAIDLTPRVRVFRRALLRSMLNDVPPVVAAGGTKLPKVAANELQALAAQDV